MALTIRPVDGKRDLKTFIYWPAELYRDVPQWVPPLYMTEREFYDPARNPAFEHAEARCWLAERDGATVGRVMGIVQHRMNKRFGTRNARFCNLDFVEDPEVCCGLLGAVEDWAREHGMESLSGPHGFSDSDPEGMLIKGFEHRATIASYYNFPYVPRLVEGCGFQKDFDYRIFRIEIPKEPPPIYVKIKQRLERQGFVLAEFTKTRQIKPHLDNFVIILNATFEQIYGYVELTPDEGRKLIKDYLQIIDPHFLKFIYKLPRDEVGRPIDPERDEVVGFMVGMPDITEGIQQARGRLLPFGIFKILKARRTTRQLDLFFAGIRDEYRNRGLSAMFAVGFLRDANEQDLEYIDAHQELEFNHKVHDEWSRFESSEYKRSRIFVKELVPGGLERYQQATADVILRDKVAPPEENQEYRL
jgi:hypothetical protein